MRRSLTFFTGIISAKSQESQAINDKNYNLFIFRKFKGKEVIRMIGMPKKQFNHRFIDEKIMP